MDATTARAPLSHTCDASTAGRLARAGTFAPRPARRFWPLLMIAAAAGIAYAQIYNPAAGVVASVLTSALVLGMSFLRLRNQLRRSAGATAVLTTGYDPQERFVLTSNQGATGLARGAVASARRTGGSPASSGTTSPTGSPTTSWANDLLPHHHVVTEQDRRAMLRAAIHVWLARPPVWVSFGAAAVVLILGLVMRMWTLVALALVVGFLCGRAPLVLRRILSQIYPVGSEVRAGLVDDGLLLVLPVSTEKVLYRNMVSVAAGPEATVIRLPDRRSMYLPADLLPAPVAAELRVRASRL